MRNKFLLYKIVDIKARIKIVKGILVGRLTYVRGCNVHTIEDEVLNRDEINYFI